METRTALVIALSILIFVPSASAAPGLVSACLSVPIATCLDSVSPRLEPSQRLPAQMQPAPAPAAAPEAPPAEPIAPSAPEAPEATPAPEEPIAPAEAAGPAALPASPEAAPPVAAEETAARQPAQGEAIDEPEATGAPTPSRDLARLGVVGVIVTLLILLAGIVTIVVVEIRAKKPRAGPARAQPM